MPAASLTSLLGRLPSSATSRLAFASIGLGCYLRLLVNANRALLGAFPLDEAAPYLPHLLFIGLLTAVFVLGIACRKRADAAFLHSPWPSLLSLLLCLVGFLLNLFFAGTGSDLAWPPFSCAVVFGLGFPCAFVAWGAALYKLEQRPALLATLLALAVYGLLNLGAFARPVLSPAALNALVAVLMVAAWCLCYRENRPIAPREEASTLRELPWQTLSVFLIGVLACAVTSALLALDEQDHKTLAGILASILLPLLVSGALIAAFERTESEEAFHTILSIANVLLIVIALLLAVVFMAVDSTSRIPSTVLRVAKSLCTVCCIAVLSQAMHRRALSPTLLFSGLGIAAFALPTAVEYYLVPTLDSNTNAFLATYDEVIALGVAAVLIIVAFLSLAMEHLLAISGEEEGDDDGAQLAYDVIAQGYGLTPREKEVMELIAGGNSMKKIAESLFISLGTVQSHSKAIYRKLGIHSRQELVELVNEHLPAS